MNVIWANRLIAGTKSWEQAPESRREAVKDILQKRVAEGFVSAGKYQEVTGEVYAAAE